MLILHFFTLSENVFLCIGVDYYFHFLLKIGIYMYSDNIGGRREWWPSCSSANKDIILYCVKSNMVLCTPPSAHLASVISLQYRGF